MVLWWYSDGTVMVQGDGDGDGCLRATIVIVVIVTTTTTTTNNNNNNNTTKTSSTLVMLGRCSVHAWSKMTQIKGISPMISLEK